MLKLKLQYFGYLMQRTDSLEKTLTLGKIEGRRTTEGETIGWHHRLNWDEFEQSLGVGEGQAWRAAVHGVAKSQTWLSDWTELMGPGMQVSLASRVRQPRGVLWVAATKIGAPDTCTSTCSGDTGDLKSGKGSMQGWHWPSVPGVCSSRLRDVCVQLDACSQADT